MHFSTKKDVENCLFSTSLLCLINCKLQTMPELVLD